MAAPMPALPLPPTLTRQARLNAAVNATLPASSSTPPPSPPRASLTQLPNELLASIVDLVYAQDVGYEERVHLSEIDFCREIAKVAEKQTGRQYDHGIRAVYGTCRVLSELARKKMFERITIGHARKPYFKEHIASTHCTHIQAIVLNEPSDFDGTSETYRETMNLDILSLLQLIPSFPNFSRLRFSSLFAQASFWTHFHQYEGDRNLIPSICKRVTTLKFTNEIQMPSWVEILALFTNVTVLTILTLTPEQEEVYANFENLEDLQIVEEGVCLSDTVKWKGKLKSLNVSILDHEVDSDNWAFVCQFANSLEEVQLVSHFLKDEPAIPWTLEMPFKKLMDLRVRASSKVGMALLKLFKDSPLVCIDLDLDEARELEGWESTMLKERLEPFSKTLKFFRENRQEEPFALTSPLSEGITTFLTSIGAERLPNLYCDHPTFYKPHELSTPEETPIESIKVGRKECVEGVKEVLEFARRWIDRSVALGDDAGVAEACALIQPLATRMLTERD